MRKGSVREFWGGKRGPDVTDDVLAEIKREFDIAGEVRAVTFAPGYAVSSCGRMFSTVPCAWERQSCNAREMKASVDRHGYRVVGLHVEKHRRRYLVHRIVAMVFIGDPPTTKSVARHLDGNPTNNSVGNLAWGTQKDNMEDCRRHGRILVGSKSTSAKLTEDVVGIIRQLHSLGFDRVAMSVFFGVGVTSIDDVVSGRRWKHLE